MSARFGSAWVVTILCCSLCACSMFGGGGGGPRSFAATEKPAEEAGPLGGPSLSQRRETMERMYKDLVHFRTAIEHADERGDDAAAGQLAYFVGAYINMHLDPLLAGEWQSRHPELFGLDADLRIAKADVFMRMNERGQASDVLDEVEKRYSGRADMLVHYPVGGQNPLGKAVKLLRESN
jgi:hypothetical protein